MFTLRKPTIPKSISAILCAMIILSACAPKAEQVDRFVASVPVEAPASGEFQSKTLDSSIPNQTIERIVIKNASLTLVVTDPADALANISRLAEQMGGFVVSASLYQERLDSGAEAPRGSITIRIPAKQLDEALTKIRAESQQDPLSENINSQDVTSEYTDLQSRLSNLEATEAQLTKIMEQATTTEDVLAVYNQLVATREQIEVIKGQINYYEQSAALSSVTVELVADEAVRPLSIGGWEPVGVVKNAVQALINTLKFLANALIFIIILILPILGVLYLVFFLPLRLAWRWLRRGKVKLSKSPPPPKTS